MEVSNIFGKKLKGHMTTQTSAGRFWSPSGRISRDTYWRRIASLLGICLLAIAVTEISRRPNIVVALLIVLAMALVFPQVAKRCHDCGWSGWWSLLLAIPPVTLLVILVVGLVPSKQPLNVPLKDWDGLHLDSAENERQRARLVSMMADR